MNEIPAREEADDAIETGGALETLEAPLVLPPVDESEVDAGNIVEEAELLLRESAPHDFEVLVIGGGPGGSVAAIKAAQLGAKVGLIEARELGGVCLNRGCIPTKTLLESVEVLRLLRSAAFYGIHIESAAQSTLRPDVPAMHARKRDVIAALRENVARQLESAGVKVLSGHARFVAEHTVEITKGDGETRRVSAIHVVIASGSLPRKLEIPGADLPGVLTSDDLLLQESVPDSLVVVGGGAVGVEFAYLMLELGARTTLLEVENEVLPGEDEAIRHHMSQLLRGYGLTIEGGAKLTRIERDGSQLRVFFERDGREQSTLAAQVLMATGRRANTDDLDLEAAGIAHQKGVIQVDENCETNVGGVYAIGDCVRGVGWAHQASGEGTLVAEIVTGNAPSVDLKHLPLCYYTHPEIASVGLTLDKARQKGIEARAGVFHFRANGRAAAAGEHDGFVKIVIESETQKVIGCQIIGPRATELINEAVASLKAGHTAAQMAGALHAHPTFGEALPEAALMAMKASHNSPSD